MERHAFCSISTNRIAWMRISSQWQIKSDTFKLTVCIKKFTMYPSMGEADHSATSSTTYYLRSKRRRKDNGEEVTSSEKAPATLKRKSPIMHMPLEVLQHIFQFISKRELSASIRQVNRRFRTAAEDLLNSTFKSLGDKVKMLIASTYKAIESTCDDMEVKCFCRLLNLLDIINFQHSVIMATIWRYVYNTFYRTTKSCMYGGVIIDLYETLFRVFYENPAQIYAPAVLKEYTLPEEIKRIIFLTKVFCIHFDRVSEQPLQNWMLAPGCKIIDLLDSALYAERKVIYEERAENSFCGQYRYYFPNSWFLTFGIPPGKRMQGRQQQQMMHMRMRRIVLSHTEMFMQQSHYDRECSIRTTESLREPNVMVYTGFGDVHNRFFFYGSMNDAAYIQKFHNRGDDSDQEQDEDDLDEEMDLARLIDDNMQNNARGIMELDENELIPDIPHLGLDINVQVECPMAFAPCRFLQSQQLDSNNNLRHGLFEMKIDFDFPGAYYTRLPTNYVYYKRFSTRHSKKGYVVQYGSNNEGQVI